MAHIQINEGLDIPIKGRPEGEVQSLSRPKTVSLNLGGFVDVKFRLLTKVGDRVQIGQPMTEDKGHPGCIFVAPGSGIVKEVRRGAKRRILDIVIELDAKDEYHIFPPLDPKQASSGQIIERLAAGGVLMQIRARPFDLLANPKRLPRSIFVKAIESAPFAVPAELQVKGYERQFHEGLSALSRLTQGGKVHLVYRQGSDFRPFTEAQSVERHTVAGPHPAGNSSVHIHNLDPVRGPEDLIWTLSAKDVVAIGELLVNGRYHVNRVVSIAGPGVIPAKRGYFQARLGYPIEGFLQGRLAAGSQRLICGDPLCGYRVEAADYLGFYETQFTVIPDEAERELLHFFRLGINKFTASSTYLSGHIAPGSRDYDFTTSNHGEERAFIDGAPYEKVMPMRIPTMHLIKAFLAEDLELAESLGALEVAPEDFALAAFVCPSKIDMLEISRDALRKFAKELVG